jgi:hypothetical protein
MGSAVTLQLRSSRFRAEREDSWLKLERLLARAERDGPRGMTDDELVAIPALYRAALSSLNTARAISLDQALIDYLEALCGRAYVLVYGARASLGERIGRFFAHDWPVAVRALSPDTLVAALALLPWRSGSLYGLVASRSRLVLQPCAERPGRGPDAGSQHRGAPGPRSTTARPTARTAWACSPPFCSPTTPGSPFWRSPWASLSACRPSC